MIKLFVIILSFGLSTLLTLMLNFDEAWKTGVGIVGFGLGFILLFVLIFFFVISLYSMRIKKNEIPAKYSSSYRKIYNLYQRFLLSLFSVKLIVNGMDKVPNDTNFILLQNHCSNVDPIFTDFVFRKYPLIFVSKESLFKIPFFGKVIRHIGYVKLTRKSGMDDANEIIRGLRWVRAGECSLCVYPEGTRNKTYPDPILLDLKEESLAIAKKSGKPIVITVIHGSDKINNKLLLKIHKIQIDVLTVINPIDYENLTPGEIASNVKKLMLEEIQNPSKAKEKVRLF